MDPSRSCPCIRKNWLYPHHHQARLAFGSIMLMSDSSQFKIAFIHIDNNAFYCTSSRVSITDTTCLIGAWRNVTVTSLYGQYASNGRRRCMMTLTNILLGTIVTCAHIQLYSSPHSSVTHPVRDSVSDLHWAIHSSLHGGSNSHKSIRGGAI